MNAKKQARRNAAAKRFTILSFHEYAQANIVDSSLPKFNRFDRRCAPTGVAQRADYDRYVAAKNVEKAALGL